MNSAINPLSALPENDASFPAIPLHGGTPEADFDRLGISPRPVLDFSVNISPLGPPDPVRRCWPALVAELTRYPDLEGAGVKYFYRKRFNLSPESVLPGNGSAELMYDLPRILRLKRALIPQPAFHDYTRACQAAGMEIIHGLPDRIEGCDAVFIGNPNNPDGKLLPAPLLLEMAEQFPETLFFVDEAFMQFLPDPDPFTLMRTDRLRRNILIFHSLTKLYALPGIRLGACIGHPATIRRLATRRAPWMVSRAAERIAEVLADCRDYEKRLVALVAVERERMLNRLRTRPDQFRVQSGAANFFTAQWLGSANLDDLLRHLLERGLYIRDARNFRTLEANWFRTAVRLPEENHQLLEALTEP